MPAAEHPANENKRLAALRSYHVLDTPVESCFDELTQLAAELFDVPIALISLVDQNRQWFKSRVGLDAQETCRDHAFCAHAILSDETLVVPDARTDPRFSDNPLVFNNPHVIFYAGAPLVAKDDYRLGTLCLIDHEPREFGIADREKLAKLARQVVGQLDLHRILAERQREAETDELTGLANRRGVLRSGDLEPGAALFLIDLDRFKPINDTLGHQAGDHVLKTVGQRILQCLQDRGIDNTPRRCSRIGGDEFVLRVPSADDADELADSLIQAIEEPIGIAGRRVTISASVGYAVAEDHTLPAKEALRQADIAMYHGKVSPAEKYLRFTAEMEDHIKSMAEMEDRLRTTIAADQIDVAYQPVVDLQSGELRGWEALARWTDEKLGVVRPDHFIELAERIGVIEDLFERVATKAFRQLKHLPGPRIYWVSLNVSAVQLHHPRLVDWLEAALAEYDLKSHQVHLEITESAVAEGPEALARLATLSEMGFSLMLDDFGTGTSSLSQLHALPLDWVKIDRSFVMRACEDRALASVVQSIAMLASNLKLGVVAEGIETYDQLQIMQALDIHAGQGYLFGKPGAMTTKLALEPQGRVVHAAGI